MRYDFVTTLQFCNMGTCQSDHWAMTRRREYDARTDLVEPESYSYTLPNTRKLLVIRLFDRRSNMSLCDRGCHTLCARTHSRPVRCRS